MALEGPSLAEEQTDQTDQTEQTEEIDWRRAATARKREFLLGQINSKGRFILQTHMDPPASPKNHMVCRGKCSKPLITVNSQTESLCSLHLQPSLKALAVDIDRSHMKWTLTPGGIPKLGGVLIIWDTKIGRCFDHFGIPRL